MYGFTPDNIPKSYTPVDWWFTHPDESASDYDENLKTPDELLGKTVASDDSYLEGEVF